MRDALFGIVVAVATALVGSVGGAFYLVVDRPAWTTLSPMPAPTLNTNYSLFHSNREKKVDKLQVQTDDVGWMSARYCANMSFLLCTAI
jgi:hypothetical protein